MAPSRALRSRKKQTRLEFQPLTSSSTLKSGYSEAIQDRLANVRYEGAQRKDNTAVENQKHDIDSLISSPPSPTAQFDDAVRVPIATSPLSSLRTSPAVPPRFTAVSITSSEDDDDVIISSSKRKRRATPSDDGDTPPAKSARHSARVLTQSSPLPSRPNLRSNDGVFSTPARRSSRLLKSSPPLRRSQSPTNSQHFLSPARNISDIGSAETSDNDVLVTKPASRRRSIRRKSPDKSFVVEEEEDHLTPSNIEKSTQRRDPRKRSNKDDFVIDDDEIEYVTSEEESTNLSKSRQNTRTSRSAGSPKTPKNRFHREREEIQADLLDLQDSDQEISVGRSRTRGGPVTTQRDKTRAHLELLKQRRRGGKKENYSIDDSDHDQDDVGEDIGLDSGSVSSQHDRDEGQPDQYIHLEDDHDDDFVVEDTTTGGRLGRPNSDIPLQFTSFASAKPKELFPHIVEWTVKNKISPAFNRNDDVYRISITRLDDQVKAQAGSRLISAAWSAAFRHAILARPGIRVKALPGLDEDNIRTCDACNKTNHPARYDFTFSGKAYFNSTLEPVDETDNDDTDEDRDAQDNRGSVSRDEDGHDLASEGTHFYLGRFCAANAEMGHKLTHWKHHLNQQVLDYLEEQGVLSAEAIVSRDKRSKKKREREAENIVDMMQETGMIDELWQAFQDDLEDARIGMEGHERKGGRSTKRIGSVRVRRGDGTVGDWIEGGKFQRVQNAASDSEGE